MYTIEVSKTGAESSTSLIRRFTKRVQGSSILRAARARRYSERLKSELKKKKEALKRMAKHEEYERLKKLGKIKTRS